MSTPKQPARSIAPTQYARRSQLYRRHLNAGARFEEIAGTAAVAEYAEGGNEVPQAARLAVADMSALPRMGLKGGGARAWLNERSARVPNAPNQALRQKDGSLVARLSVEEFWLLGRLTEDSALSASLQDRWSIDSTKRVYALPRADSHCCLALTGHHASATLAKVCAVDLRTHKFADLEIAQTSLAEVNAVVLRADLATTPCFFVLCDASETEYLWDVMLDAMTEFGGVPVGIAALRTLDAKSKDGAAAPRALDLKAGS
jgi:sarcosine oxidase subunit gamma